METRIHAVAAAALICMLPASPQATSLRASGAGTAPCGGAAITPDKVITGSFGKSEQGAYVMAPFDVPAGTTAVRVKYCFDKPENQLPNAPVVGSPSHTIDLGLYEPERDGDGIYGPAEFRGIDREEKAVTVTRRAVLRASRGD